MITVDIGMARQLLLNIKTDELIGYDAFAALDVDANTKLKFATILMNEYNRVVAVLEQDESALAEKRKGAESKAEKLKEYISLFREMDRAEAVDTAKQRLFVDMDGTLAVFSPVNQLETLYEKGYFENLQPQEYVVNAIREIVNNHPEIEVNILSAYLSDSPYALEEKNAWLDKHLPEINPENRIFMPCGEDKKDYVANLHETDWLLDDYTQNLKAWEPPARGIKLLTDINNTHGSWTSDRIRFDKPATEIANNIISVMHGESVLDENPVRRDERDDLKDLFTEWCKDNGIEQDVISEACNQGAFLRSNFGKSQDFRLYGRDEVASVAVFSNPINALSHASINKREFCDFKDTDRIAPGGNVFNSLVQYLDENPNIKNITLCTNNDATGDKAALHLKNQLFKAGYTPENGYHCERQIPTGHRDFSEQLRSCFKESNRQHFESVQDDVQDFEPEEGDD